MITNSISFCAFVLLAKLVPIYAENAISPGGGGSYDTGLSRYLSRSDLAAPKWDVKIYHKDLISPGYWFVAPYKAIDQDQAERPWVGPHIYDGLTGELVWSGSLSFGFSNGNVEDFRVSNVNGQYRMTLMSQMTGEGVILDSSYRILDRMRIGNRLNVNMHEFNFVENGTRALVIKSDSDFASKEESEKVGFDGSCRCAFDGFEELDTSNWTSTFRFQSQGVIRLEESSLTRGNVSKQCLKHWDFIHSNSVDKDPRGDYYWSARHTDTIYKISGKTGEVIWRLGGKFSDFPIDEEWRFSRQHNIRFRGENGTHILLSMLDNAKGIDAQPPTNPYSRGMLLAVDEENKKAKIQRQYNHPSGEGFYAPRRGNYQVLENGNVFMSWSERAIQSEHTEDGQLVMEAMFETKWLGTYRSYKFAFVGHPIEPPVAVSQAYATSHNSTITAIYVTWNGATEVHTWSVYRTVANGRMETFVAETKKFSFETIISYNGYASYVIAEALDKNGDVLGRTSIVKTFAHENVSHEAILEEQRWLQDAHIEIHTLYDKVESTLSSPLVAFFVGVVVSGLVLLFGRKMRSAAVVAQSIEGTKYDRLPNSGEQSESQLPLQSYIGDRADNELS